MMTRKFMQRRDKFHTWKKMLFHVYDHYGVTQVRCTLKYSSRKLHTIKLLTANLFFQVLNQFVHFTSSWLNCGSSSTHVAVAHFGVKFNSDVVYIRVCTDKTAVRLFGFQCDHITCTHPNCHYFKVIDICLYFLKCILIDYMLCNLSILHDL